MQWLYDGYFESTPSEKHFYDLKLKMNFKKVLNGEALNKKSFICFFFHNGNNYELANISFNEIPKELFISDKLVFNIKKIFIRL